MSDVPDDDPFLADLLRVMSEPIIIRCLTCQCPEDSHSQILVDAPCLDCTKCEHFVAPPYGGCFASIVPLIIRPDAYLSVP